MDGRIDVTTIIFIVVLVVIVLKLRSVLGRRTGDDTARYERYKTQRTNNTGPVAPTRDKVVQLPRRDREEAAARPPAAEAAAAVDHGERIKELAQGNSGVADGLRTIVRADGSFNPDLFLAGARSAYEMIVTAFAEGNRKTLKGLLAAEVYDGFVGAIAEREQRGEMIDQSFVGIKSADIVEAELQGSDANVTVRFVSELIKAVRDRSGTILSGDDKRIGEVTDVWTFRRNVNSRSPNWELVATQAAG